MELVEAARSIDRCPSHPGLLIEEAVEASGRSKTEIAQLLGISRQHLHDLTRGRKPVSAVVAVRLGKLFGNGPDLWIRMQAAHDIWQAQQTVDVSAIPTIAAA